MSLSLSFEGGDDPRGVVAEGSVDGVEWVLRWVAEIGQLLWFAGDDHGSVAPAPGALAVGIGAVGGRTVVWGLAPGASVACRVTDQHGAEHLDATTGPELGGSAAFAVTIPAGTEPAAVAALDRHGDALATRSLVPSPTGLVEIADRIDVRAVDRPADPPKLGTVIGEGRVDDSTWTYRAALYAGDLDTFFRMSAPWGGGGGGGMGVVPRPRPGRRVALDGSGTDGRTWHATGWADRSVARARLHLATGEVLDLPVLGDGLGLEVRLLAVALPVEARALFLDGLGEDGTLIERRWLGDRFTSTERSIADMATRSEVASAPVPLPVSRFWRDVTGSELDEAEQDGRSADTRIELARAEVIERWPVRPVLVPSWLPFEVAAEAWVITAHHLRRHLSQVVGFGLDARFAPTGAAAHGGADHRALLDSGVILFGQGVGWSPSASGPSEQHNTHVRGAGARLEELTLSENNIDVITLSWHEPPSRPLPEPLTGVSVWLEASPGHYSGDDVLRIAEGLRPLG